MKNISYASLIILGLFICACSENNNLMQEPAPPIPEITEDPTFPLDSDNFEIPDQARFKVALYDYLSFNGDKYSDNPVFATPAPFDFLSFRILMHDDFYSPFGFQPYQCYDSIVWSSPEHPESLRIYEDGYNGMHFTSQWGSYFYNEGINTVYLRGYRNGEIIHSDSLTFELKDRDFLCFNWAECPTKPNTGVTHGIYCTLDSEFEYSISFPIEIDGKKCLNIYILYRGMGNDEVDCNRMKTMLEYFLESHIGEPVRYNKADLKYFFKLLPADEEFGNLYENKTTRAIIVDQQPDKEGYRLERYYIHVESK